MEPYKCLITITINAQQITVVDSNVHESSRNSLNNKAKQLLYKSQIDTMRILESLKVIVGKSENIFGTNKILRLMCLNCIVLFFRLLETK